MSTRLHSIPHTPTPPLSPPVPPHYQLQPPTPHCHSTLRSGCPLQTKCFCVQTSLTSFFLISSALDLVQGLSPPAEVAHSHAWWGWGPRPLPGVRVRSNPGPVGGVPGAHQLAPPPALPWRVPRQPPRLLPVCRVARAKGFLRTVCTVAAWITGVSISFRPLFHRPLPSVGIFRCICVLHLIAYCTMNHFSVCRRVGGGSLRIEKGHNSPLDKVNRGCCRSRGWLFQAFSLLLLGIFPRTYWRQKVSHFPPKYNPRV